MQQNKNQKILKALEKLQNDNTKIFPFMFNFDITFERLISVSSKMNQCI